MTLSDPSVSLAPEMAEETKAYAQALAHVKAFDVTSPATLDTAGNLARGARENWRALEARRTEITRPLLLAKRRVDDLFKESLAALAEIEHVLKAKIAAYTARVEDERRATMVISAAEHAAGGLPTHVVEAPAKTAGVSVRFFWDVEVVSPELVPRDLCSPDLGKIRAAIAYADTENPPLEIPGCRFFQRDRVTVR